MLQAEIDAEVESAFKDLIEKLPDAEVRQHWMDLAKEQIKRELADKIELRQAIELIHERLEMLLSTHTTRRH
jgi:secreted Zn-dependent insulinase-like peptidase